MSEKVINALRELLPERQIIITGTVTAVRPADLVCDVQPEDGAAELLNVRLRLVNDGLDDGLLVVPALGSTVAVIMLDEHTGVLSQATTVQFYSIRTQDESLKQLLSDLLDALQKLTVTTPNGPSGTPINAPAFGALKIRLNHLFSG